MTSLFDSIQKRINLTDELKKEIEFFFNREEIKNKEEILREGQYCKKLYFLESGTVRTYYFHQDKEVSSWFYKEGLYFTSWYSFYTSNAGYESIDVLEDSVVYSITHDNFIKLINKSQEFERFARLLAEEQIAYTDQFFKGFMFYSAKEKYQLLLAYFPDIELKVKLGYIASFLGISRETLSRIRANH